MDKYTVDLDKVLNDFEYSELTEQNQTSVNNSSAQKPMYNGNKESFEYHSYPKAPLTVSKHSINNVFHSLNEYLNTDIKSDVAKPSTSCVSNITEIQTLPLVRKDNNIVTIENIFKSITSDEIIDTATVIKDLEPINNNIDSKNFNNEITQVAENSESIEITNTEITENTVENTVVDVSDDKIEVTIIKKPEPIKFGDLEVSDTELENELAELEQEYIETDDNSQQNKNLKSELEELETETTEAENQIQPEIISTEKNINEAETVGPVVENEICDNVNNEFKENVSDVNEEKEEETIVQIRPSSLDLTNENLTINLIGGPGSTPYNNLYSNTLPESEATKNVVDDPNSNSLSPTTLSDTSTYENSQSDSATSDTGNDTSLDEPEVPTNGQNNEDENEEHADSSHNDIHDVSWLGKTAPFWTPDCDALCCLHCDQKFTVLKRRHHCRACGLVLCSKCCNMKCKLEYMDNLEARVCLKCFEILSQVNATLNNATSTSGNNNNNNAEGSNNRLLRPGNPMDYCSTVPPHQQVSSSDQAPPTVMVPVGVLKRQGSGKTRANKSVIFMDGIRPGCDLTELDQDFNYKAPKITAATDNSTPNASSSNINHQNNSRQLGRVNRNLPKVDATTGCYIPNDVNFLPPIVTVVKSDVFYGECCNNENTVEMLKNEMVTFAIQRNLHVQLRIINMDCCINKCAWCFSTEGMIAVGQDEIVILLEFIDNEKCVPKDIFLHLNQIYNDAVVGTSIPEMGISIHSTSNFLDSKNHVGFLYIKPTFQCIQNVLIPNEPYLIGILIHRWETPWAKIFPLRLLLRLGAEYRYYPSPIISTRNRESVYVEIGHTIINLLADFRSFSYSLPVIRGLTIHMEDKKSVVSIPRNRYEQIMRALNNASDHILALAAAFNSSADSHLVCIQDTHGNNENNYTTHAINIHNKPRKVTGASFIVLNGALKSSTGLTAKSSIIEDGLMIQIPAEQMQKLRNALRNMKDFKILCGPVNAQSDESVTIIWVQNDVNFNIGVTSPIDHMSLGGIPSIRVHNGRDFICNSGNKMIRWTEVFIIQSGEESVRTTAEPVDVSRVSEAISKATSQALVKYLDLLATNSQTKIAIRVSLNIENVSYLAGSNGTKLPPIYMKSLDNELIPVLHRISAGFSENVTVSLELMFHILNC